jgi:hypothetical protein
LKINKPMCFMYIVTLVMAVFMVWSVLRINDKFNNIVVLEQQYMAELAVLDARLLVIKDIREEIETKIATMVEKEKYLENLCEELEAAPARCNRKEPVTPSKSK